METKNRREVSVSLAFEVVPVGPGGAPGFACLGCGAPLDVHQPDAGTPDRLLATCAECQSWHLIECEPDGAEAVVAVLPGLSAARTTPAPAPAATPAKPKSKPKR